MTDDIKKEEINETEEVKKDRQSFGPAQAFGSDAQARKDELKSLQLKCEEYLNGWKRERADFLNYKKDEMERIGQLVKYSNEELILKIIPILDNIYLAEIHIPEEFKNNNPANSAGASWIEGFGHIKNQLRDFLKKEGIEAIETVGKPFDPNTMEAVGEAEGAEQSRSTVEPGIVVEEVQQGYTMQGKIIRVAKVKISK